VGRVRSDRLGRRGSVSRVGGRNRRLRSYVEAAMPTQRRLALCFALATCAVMVLDFAFATATPAGAQTAKRGIPRRLRERLLGCHQLGDQEQMVIARDGPTGLRARFTAIGRHGIVERSSAVMFYRVALDAVEIGCGAETQHGQYCLFSVDAAGVLRGTRVSRYSRRGTEMTLSACR